MITTMNTYEQEYAELCALLEKQEEEFAEAYAKYQAEPTPANRDKAEMIAYSISDTKWDMKRNYASLYYLPHRNEETSYSYLTH